MAPSKFAEIFADYISGCSITNLHQIQSKFKQTNIKFLTRKLNENKHNKLKMVSKLIICLVLAALVGCAVAQLIPISGTRDLTGGYYDHYTGQYSSALTGRVYNTAPAVVAGKSPSA